jgi:hypothetical protein
MIRRTGLLGNPAAADCAMAVALPSASTSPTSAPKRAPNLALVTDLNPHCTFTLWMFIDTLLLELIR